MELLNTDLMDSDQVQSLQEKIESLEYRLENVQRIGAMITSIFDVDTILSVLMESGLELVEGEVGGIITKKEGRFESQISMGLDLDFIKSLRIKNRGPLLDIVTVEEEILYIKNTEEMLETDRDHIRVNSMIAAPVASRGEIIGAIFIANKADGGLFSSNDVSNIEMLVHFAAVAIDNAMILQLKLDNQRMEHELRFGQQVQAALLPSEKLTIPDVIIDATYTPARQVGGDYYDVIVKDDKHFAIVIGDVTNKGVPAALMMSAVRSLIRAEYRNGKDVSEVINSVNQLMCEDSERTRDMFVTLFYGHMDLEKRGFSFINAGHPPPFLIKRGNGDLIQLQSRGIIVGQFPEFVYRSSSEYIDSGDRIVLYTDGAFECFDSKGQMLGLSGFKESIMKFGALESPLFLKKINQQLERYMVDKDKIDDTTLLVIDLQ